VHSVGLQPDGELQIVVSASQTELLDSLPGKSRPNLFRAILGVPLFIRADVTSTDHYELKYEPNSIRVTKRQIAELQAFIHTHSAWDHLCLDLLQYHWHRTDDAQNRSCWPLLPRDGLVVRTRVKTVARLDYGPRQSTF